MWANTSAVSTAGFFGNAAVLLAGVYLLSHSDQLVEIADGVNKLLPSADDDTNHYHDDEAGEVTKMIQKGKEIMGETLDKINKNVKKLSDKVNANSGGLLQQLPKLPKLDNPLKKLKDKLFPATTTPETVVDHHEPQVLSISADSQGPVFHEEFFTNDQTFGFGVRTGDKDDGAVDPMVLVFPESDYPGQYDEDNLPFLLRSGLHCFDRYHNILLRKCV